MAECMLLLNPPKAFDTKILPVKNISSPSIFPLTGTNLKFKKFATISAPVMQSQNQTQGKQQLSLADALLNSNCKEQALAAIRTSLSNRLPETNLQLTVPGLKSKTRGKVRDIYDSGDYLVLVTTDRQSAFDRILLRFLSKARFLTRQVCGGLKRPST